MLYLEDYLEMIEHLPQEMRDRFTEIRELDLAVQNNMDSLDKKSRSFFQQCKRGDLQGDLYEAEYEKIAKDYERVLEDADEKVNIATQVQDLVERYLRRLDSELFKFKCELEADNNGITEILEKRSLENEKNSTAASALLNVINPHQKENRYYDSLGTSNISTRNSHSSVISVPSAHSLSGSSGVGAISIVSSPTIQTKENRYRTPKSEKRRNSGSTTNITTAPPEKRPNLINTLTPTNTPVTVVRPITPNLGAHSVLNSATATIASPSTAAAVAYNLQQLGGSASNAIAAAASQAIVATQQMQQGRRTASLKASYEAIHGAGGGPTEFWISRDIANAATAAAQNTHQQNMTPNTTEKKQKKKLSTAISHGNTTTSIATPSSVLSLTSPSSSLSVDSLDMLPTSSGAAGNVSFAALGLSGIGSSGASTSTAANRAGSASSSTSSSAVPSSSLTLNENGLVVEQEGEWSYDPNEPRYCTCNQVSYGDMVACDNDACPYEWFHYPCVGITQPPKGKWYCPKCTASMRRRGNRKT